MTPALLLPMALAALTALAIPLILHIARRSEEQPTIFAALRWLRQKPKPRARLRLDEWPLLIARLILLTLVAFWLAKPVLFGAGGDRAYVAVAPGVDRARAEAIAGETPAHWLAPRFPPLSEAPPTGAAPLASLIRQLDSELPEGARLTVVTPAVISGADADRLRVSRRIDWQVVAGETAAPETATPATEALTILYDPEHAAAVRYLRAAGAAWAAPGQAAAVEVGSLDQPLPTRERVLVWMGGGTLPETLLRWVRDGGRALVASDATIPEGPRVGVWGDALGQPLAEAMPWGAGRMIRLTRPLTPAQTPELLDGAFPSQLRTLVAAPPPAPTRVEARAYAPLVERAPWRLPPMDLQPWLAVLVAGVLLVERWLATSRRRGVAP